MKKWLHIIGVCGKATSQIAVLYKEKGWFVTGSDAQYFPPAKDVLEENNILTAEGYHYSHLTKSYWEEQLNNGQLKEVPEVPDRAIIIETASEKNKEYLFAKKQGIQVTPFSQLLGEALVKVESIVVVGTAGKTTTTGLITHALRELGIDPSYMVGGDVVTLDTFIKDTDSQYSVLEGDEYHSKTLSNGAKFLEYKPKYLVITNIGWEHQDVFPTQEAYIEEFRKAVRLVPENGLIVAKADDENIDEVIKEATCTVIRYGVGSGGYKDSQGNRIIRIVRNSQSRKSYTIKSLDDKGNETTFLKGNTKLIGELNLYNIVSTAILLSNLLQVSKDKLIDAIETFNGVKKRMEVVLEKDELIVIDDFAPAPNRVKNSLQVLKEEFPEHQIIALFEPNSASRPQGKSLFRKIYKGSFSKANQVFIPELSSFSEDLADSDTMVEILQEMFNEVDFSAIDAEKMVEVLKGIVEDQKKTLVVFYSSYRLENVMRDFIKKNQV